ncbi:hypothetical protein GCM10009548_42880 [Streptomyces malaysiensis subsp. malaysiensis]
MVRTVRGGRGAGAASMDDRDTGLPMGDMGLLDERSEEGRSNRTSGMAQGVREKPVVREVRRRCVRCERFSYGRS